AEGGVCGGGRGEGLWAAAVPAQDLAGAVVAVDVRPHGEAALRAAVDVASGDGAAPARMVVVEEREDVVLRAATEGGIDVRAEEALEDAPAIVAAADDRRVDLLSRPLSHVPDPLLGGAAI